MKTIKQRVKELGLVKKRRRKAKEPKKYKEVIRKDSNGNILYRKFVSGYEEWHKYDSEDKMIHYKNSKGLEYWNQHHSNGWNVHSIEGDGKECWTERDLQGNILHRKDSNGYEEWNEYDLKTFLINSLIAYADGRYEYNMSEMVVKRKKKTPKFKVSRSKKKP